MSDVEPTAQDVSCVREILTNTWYTEESRTRAIAKEIAKARLRSRSELIGVAALVFVATCTGWQLLEYLGRHLVWR